MDSSHRDIREAVRLSSSIVQSWPNGQRREVGSGGFRPPMESGHGAPQPRGGAQNSEKREQGEQTSL